MPLPPPCRDNIQFVPSLAVPNQMVLVQQLSDPPSPLNTQDLYVLQRTVIPAGQLWLYNLASPSGALQTVQVQMWTAPTIWPVEPVHAFAVPAPAPAPVPSPIDYALLDEAAAEFLASLETDTASADSGMTEAIYGD